MSLNKICSLEIPGDLYLELLLQYFKMIQWCSLNWISKIKYLGCHWTTSFDCLLPIICKSEGLTEPPSLAPVTGPADALNIVRTQINQKIDFKLFFPYDDHQESSKPDNLVPILGVACAERVNVLTKLANILTANS